MNVQEILLSEYGNASSIPSPVNRMMTAFAGDFRDGYDVNLGAGYVNERTIPRQLIELAYREVLAQPEKYRAALNYGGPHGSHNLIESIRRFYIDNRVGGLTDSILREKEILIGANGATSLLEGVAHLLPPGIVITSDPMYYIYCNYLERVGFRVVTIPEDENGIQTDLLRERLEKLGDEKSEIQCFYIVTINNPTSVILSNTRRRELVEIATRLSRELGRKIPLFFDKAYEDLIHDPMVERPTSGFLYDEIGIVYEIGTLSKILAPGLRIGYLIGDDGPFLRAMIQRTSDVGFSAPLINQEIASYLLDHHIREQIEKVNRGYRDKARRVKAWIEQLLGDAVLEYRGGQAGFYFYFTLDDVETHESSPFFNFLTRSTGNEEIDGSPNSRHPRVVYIPGEHCIHPKGDMVQVGKRQLRLSYGFEDLDRIRAALSFMREAISYCETRGK
ncbi:MAG: pyridoxal phosphate-dependent aminotransferase [Candidatus Poribacteria bacterium]|nr:pyridoxal phosphate-dependent aminotransferase [Candidatus Poribacteria bacterium]